nr:hypothetical protein [Methylobacterium sp. WCS2018Hpa-22]
MKPASLILGLATAWVVLGGTAQAQGIFRGAEQGAARGNAVAGPIGGIVGGAVGAGAGGVNGALGIRPRYRRVHGSGGYRVHRHRHCYQHRRHYHCH